jgi:hypothetical protein
MTIENLPQENNADLEDDSPGRGCGTHLFRVGISKLPLEERIAMADLFGEPLHLCQPSSLADAVSSETKSVTDEVKR